MLGNRRYSGRCVGVSCRHPGYWCTAGGHGSRLRRICGLLVGIHYWLARCRSTVCRNCHGLLKSFGICLLLPLLPLSAAAAAVCLPPAAVVGLSQSNSSRNGFSVVPKRHLLITKQMAGICSVSFESTLDTLRPSVLFGNTIAVDSGEYKYKYRRPLFGLSQPSWRSSNHSLNDVALFQLHHVVQGLSCGYSWD